MHIHFAHFLSLAFWEGSPGPSSRCPARSFTAGRMRSSSPLLRSWMTPPEELWGWGAGGGGLSLPVVNRNPIPMPPVPQPLCKILVIFAKLHFIDYGYFPRGLLFRIRPMISPPGAQNILLGRSCSSIQRNKTEVSPGLQILRFGLAGHQNMFPCPHPCPCLFLLFFLV